jgi:hypothetical protein
MASATASRTTLIIWAMLAKTRPLKARVPARVRHGRFRVREEVEGG